MSDAKKCDRCGRFYAEGNMARLVKEFYPSGISKTKNGGDLCPKCAAAFDRWWNKKRNEVDKQ